MTFQLNLDNLSAIRGDLSLFANLSIQLNAGELIKIEGENGAGKTTLLRMLAGLSAIQQGDIRWCGQSIAAIATEYNQHMLYLGHLPGLKLLLTPLENLRWWCALHMPSAKRDDSSILWALNQVNLSQYANTVCAQLSAGQLRRVALARLYLDSRPLWLLDEPLTAIDKAGVAHLEAQMALHLDRGGMIVLTTHQALQSNSYKTLSLEQFKP